MQHAVSVMLAIIHRGCFKKSTIWHLFFIGGESGGGKKKKKMKREKVM